MPVSTHSAFLRDTLSELLVNHVLLPCCSLLTPARFNRAVILLASHRLQSLLNALTLQVAMSNDSFTSSTHSIVLLFSSSQRSPPAETTPSSISPTTALASKPRLSSITHPQAPF